MVGKILRIAFRCLCTVVVLGVLALAVVRAYGQHRYDRARVAFTEQVGPLDVAHYQPPVFIDSYWLTDGVYAIELGRHANLVRHLLDSPDPAWRPDHRQRLERLLRHNRAALGVLHAAGGRRLGIGLDVEEAVLADTLDFRSFLRAARLLHLEGRLRLIEGEVEAAAESALALGSLAGALLREPFLASQVAASEAEQSYLELIRRLLPVADPSTLEVLRGHLERLEPELPALRRSLGAEASTLIAVLDGMRTSPSWDAASWDRAALTVTSRPPAWRGSLEPGPIERMAFRWTQELQLAEVLHRYARWVKLAERPYARFTRSLARPGSRGMSPWLLADMMVPNLIDVIERIQAVASVRQLATAAVRLRLRGLARGSYPDELPGGELRSPYTSEAILYRRLPDGAATLSYADAQALWREQSACAHAKPITLTWRLPPV